MSFSKTFSNNSSGQSTSIIPDSANALFWLNGEVIFTSGSYYFIDRSGNGRNFLITGYDFEAGMKGFPYKSAATISAPAADVTLIAADLNNYLYTAGTPNQIPVVSLFQDIDYEHKMFCKHNSQLLDSNGVEVYEPRVVDITMYNAVKLGADLTTCQTYFGVPTEITTNVYWVSKTGNDTTGTGTKVAPWKTLIKADLSGTTNYTVYCKTGTYLENVGGNYWILNKTLNYKFIGYCTITSTWDRVVRLASGNSTIEGVIIDGTNTMTHGLDIYSVGAKVSTITRCLIKNCITNLVNGGTAVETLTFNNCVFVGYPTATRASQEVKVSSPIVNSSYFVNAKTTLYNIDCTFKNSKYFDNDKTYCIITQGVGLTAYGNTFKFKSGGISQSSTYVSSKTIMFNWNKFMPTSLSGAAGTSIIFTGTINFYAKNNFFKSLITTSSNDALFISNGVNVGYINEINSNVFISKATTAFYHISTNGIGSKITNNFSWSNSTIGTHISLGGESSATNTNDNSVVTGNRLIGFKMDNPATSSSSVHCLFIGGGINIKTAYNNISHTSLGIVVKTGNSAQAYTLEGVYSNIFNDCSSPIWVRGVSGLNIFNNTIYFSTATYGQSLGNVLLCDENSAIAGTQNCSNIIFKNNIVDIKINTGTLVRYDTFAAANGCIAQNNILNGGQYLLQDGTNYTSLATAQGAGKLLNCVVQNPNLSALLAPATPIVIGENLGTAYQAGLDILTNWGDEFIYPLIVNRNQVSSGLWQVGAYIQ